MAGKFTVSTIFKGIDKISAPISRIQNRVLRFSRSSARALRKVQRASEGVERGIKRAAQATVVAGAIVTGALGSATAAGIEFEQTMVNASAKFGGSADRGSQAFDRLNARAKEVGSTTEFTATQAAEGLNFLALAGFNAENAMAALPGVVDLATAAQTDLATATDIATDSLGALGLMTQDADQLTKNLARTNDVLAKTTTSANTSLEQMFEAIKDGGPVATAAGADLETVAAMIGTMANAGIKGTRAGTALKNIFTSIAAPGSEAAEIMRRLNVQTVNADGSMRDAVAVFKDFSTATKSLPNAQQLAVFDRMFGKIPLAAALNLTAAADAMGDLRDVMYDAEGASNKMASTMRDTTRGSLNALRAAVEGVSIRMFGMTGGPFKEVIDRTTEWVRENEELIAQNIGGFILKIVNNLDKIADTAKKVAIFVTGLWALNKVLAAIQIAITVINVLMAANPFVLAALAIAAVAAAIYLAWEPIKEFFTQLWDDITASFNKAIDYIMQKIEAVKRAMSAVGEFFQGEEGPKTRQERGRTKGIPTALVSPAERTAAAMESRSVETSEVVIRDETGRAEVRKPNNRSRTRLRVAHTGGF